MSMAGKKMLEDLDTFLPPPRPTENLSTSAPSFRVIDGIGTVPDGRVETGIIKPGTVFTRNLTTEFFGNAQRSPGGSCCWR